MAHSLLAPSKRVRPLMCLIVARGFGADPDTALDPACAVELVHTASLILDDLPSMDDAQMRRGRPCCHKVFGESAAILAAIALLNRAFGLLAEALGLAPAVRSELVAVMSRAIGLEGTVGGQDLDLHGQAGIGAVSQIHHYKTGALFIAAATLGARVGGVTDARLESVREYAESFGLAFQMLDDLLDVTSNADLAGKDVNQDGAKATFVSALGVEAARREAEKHLKHAVTAVAPFGKAGRPLTEFAREIMSGFERRCAEVAQAAAGGPVLAEA